MNTVDALQCVDTDESGAASGPRHTPGRPSTVDGQRWLTVRSVLDRVFALVLLVLGLPVLLALALAVKLDSPGPVLFGQRRIGRHRRPFTVLKFRTMAHQAAPDLHREYIASLARGEQHAAGPKKLVADPRITRVGAFLRKTSLDELPQLLNVLAGQMSLVGPRPALAYELEHYEPWHFDRFLVPPGLTGLWQVSGRYRLGFQEMLSLDVEYARSPSPLLDAKILLRTPLTLIRDPGA